MNKHLWVQEEKEIIQELCMKTTPLTMPCNFGD